MQLDVGAAHIDPTGPVVAGSYTTIALTYTAGHPIDDTGYVKIVFRTASDMGRPQFDAPQAPNYCTVRATGDCRIVPRWDERGHRRPWALSLYLQVRRGYLDTGEQIIVIFGDRSGGSPGWRMQTFCEDTFEFKTLVDPIATFEFKELPTSPTLQIIPGEPVRAVCLAPSQLVVAQPFAVHLKLEDRWGNPTGRSKTMQHPGFAEAGVHWVHESDPETGLSAQSNPIRVLPRSAALHPYWADFHGQTEETCGSGTIDAYFEFARDAAQLDIVGHQGNDFELTDAFWQRVNDTTARFYAPGSLVTFPGYEWSGNTPLGGDRNVYFAAEGGRIVHSCYDLLPGKTSQYEAVRSAKELFARLRAQEGPAPFVFAHVGGRYANLAMHDEALEVAIEIHSEWGTFEWLLEEALRRGYRVGVCASSDDHKTRPGAAYPGAGEFGSLGGLTCVLAPRLDRESILRALRERHCYATTGHRCLLDVILLLGDGREAMMGDVVTVADGTPRLEGSVVGTGAIESVEIRNGLETLAILRPYRQQDLGKRLKVVWSGAETRGRARMCRWDGTLTVHDNAIVEMQPINFWNPLAPVERLGPSRLAWRSVTTGGLAGLILTLADAEAGCLEIETLQGRATSEIAMVGGEPLIWQFGGLGKQLQMYRLPAEGSVRTFAFGLDLCDLRKGDNPIYVRVAQEDGHLAWSSPIYAVVAD